MEVHVVFSKKYLVSLVWLLPLSVMAGDLGLSNAGGVDLNQGDLVSMIARIINTALLLVGVIAVAMLVYGGFLYITAQGDAKQVEKAKTVVIYSVIGIAVIGLAYSIVAFVIGAFNGGGSGGGGGRGVL